MSTPLIFRIFIESGRFNGPLTDKSKCLSDTRLSIVSGSVSNLFYDHYNHD